MLGYPPTGVLTEHEKVFLTASYERAVVGGPQAAQIMAACGRAHAACCSLTGRSSSASRRLRRRRRPAGRGRGARRGRAAARAAGAGAGRRAAPRRAAVLGRAGRGGAPGGCRASCPAQLRPRWPATATGSTWTIERQRRLRRPRRRDDRSACSRSTSSSAWPAPTPSTRATAWPARSQGFSLAEMRSSAGLRADDGRLSRPARRAAPAEVGADVRSFLDAPGAPPAQMSGTRPDLPRHRLLGPTTRTWRWPRRWCWSALGEDAYAELVGYQMVQGFGMPSDSTAALELDGRGARGARGRGAARWWRQRAREAHGADPTAVSAAPPRRPWRRPPQARGPPAAGFALPKAP